MDYHLDLHHELLHAVVFGVTVKLEWADILPDIGQLLPQVITAGEEIRIQNLLVHALHIL